MQGQQKRAVIDWPHLQPRPACAGTNPQGHLRGDSGSDVRVVLSSCISGVTLVEPCRALSRSASPLSLWRQSAGPQHRCPQKPGVIMGRTSLTPCTLRVTGSSPLTGFCTQMYPNPSCSEGDTGVHLASQVCRGASGRSDNTLVLTCSVACRGGDREGASVPSLLSAPPPPGQQGGSWADKHLARAAGRMLGAGSSHSKSGIWRGSQRKLHRPRAGGR